MTKCKNCKGTGTVSGIRKRDRDTIESKRLGKCYYCGGTGEKNVK